MNYAALILAHHKPGQLIHFCNTLKQEGFEAIIHYDRKGKDLGRLQAAGLHVGSVYDINWGGYSMVRATQWLLKQGLSTRADFFFLVSGVDYLLKTKQQIDQLINPEKIYLEHFSLPTPSWINNGGMDRIWYYHFHDQRNWAFRNNERLLKWQKHFHLKRKFPAGLQPFGGAQWFALSRKVATYLVQELSKYEWFFRYCMIPDELAIHSIIMSSPFSEAVINDNLRLIDWERGHPPPYTWQKEDLPALSQTNKIFARKFDCEEGMNLLMEIDKIRSAKADLL